MVYPERRPNVMHRSWAIEVWRPRLPQIVLTFRCPVSPRSHYYSLSWASIRKQVKLYESLAFTVVRQHRLLGSETSIWPRLQPQTPSTIIFCISQNLCSSRSLWCARGMSWASNTTLYDTWRWFILSGVQIWRIDLEQLKFEDPVCHKYVCSFVAQFLPGRIITLWAELL